MPDSPSDDPVARWLSAELWNARDEMWCQMAAREIRALIELEAKALKTEKETA